MSGDEFERGALPSWMSKDLKEIVEVASALGWKVHTASDTVRIQSVVRDDKRWVFTAGRRSTYPLNRIRREVAKYADPKIAALVIAGDELKDPTLRRLVEAALPTLEEATVDHTEEEEEARKDEEERRERIAAEQERALIQKYDPIEQRGLHPPAHIVSEKPMLAKGKSERQGYQSETTIERVWSDGSKDYACTKCDYTSPNRLSPSKHYANTHSEGLAPKPPQFEADVPDAVRYRPRRSRIEALAEILSHLMHTDTRDPVALAEAALMWVHEQSGKGSEHAAEREDLTPEETLNRIRMLLDDGGFAEIQRQVASLEQQVLDLEQRLIAEAEARNAAEVERDDLDNTLTALHELTARTKEAS
jgi:hypothetical protein